MPRFFISNARRAKSGSHINQPPMINLAYAFCLQEQSDRIYWARGSNNDSAVAIREAGTRIMDAVSHLDSPPALHFMTTTPLDTNVSQALIRNSRRQHGRSVALRNDDEKWVKFAEQFRLLRVQIGDPETDSYSHIYSRLRKAARAQLERTDLPDGRDTDFSQTDGFDLAGVLEAILNPG